MLFELYRKHLEARLLAPSTIRHQVAMLGLFFRWLGTRQSGTEKEVRDVSLQDLIDYHQHLQSHRKPQGGEISVGHRCSQMWIVKGFFRFLYERKKILIDPGARFPILRTPQIMPKGVLSNEQVLRLLAQPNLASPLGYRDRAMLELLYSSGLRGLELVRLTIYDVDFKDGTVRVLQGKWSRDRIVPLGQTAAGYLREYMAQVRPILLTKPAGKPPSRSCSSTITAGR